jgi:putative ABC transport system ATP-binding protein
MIQLKNITKSYSMGKRELKVLQGVNLAITKGEMIAIMGPSGSGNASSISSVTDRPFELLYPEGKK